MPHRPLLHAGPKEASFRSPCSAPTLYSFRAIYSRIYPPVEFSPSINGDISTTMRPAAVRFEIGGRGGRSKESRGARSRDERERASMRERAHYRKRERERERAAIIVRWSGTCAVIWRRMHHRLCHLTRVIERDTAERSPFALCDVLFSAIAHARSRAHSFPRARSGTRETDVGRASHGEF